MCKKLNVMDWYSIQDCLSSYKALVKWLPATDAEEDVMKESRLVEIEHLINLSDEILEEIIRSNKNE